MAGKKQFDVDVALERSMIAFWQRGYSDTSLDDLTAATGLNRSSLYSSFGDKNTLFLRCLNRYAERYGERYDAALAVAAQRPVEAVAAFFDVTLARIADPALPDGCFVAQSTMAVTVLAPPIAARVIEALHTQRARLRTALEQTALPSRRVDELALYLAATNQSLAVMSRGGIPAHELRPIADVALAALAHALDDET